MHGAFVRIAHNPSNVSGGAVHRGVRFAVFYYSVVVNGAGYSAGAPSDGDYSTIIGAVVDGSGPCPATGLATTATNAFGEYSFENLSPGTYCVSYDSLTDGNDTILIPGGPTYPFRGEDGFYYTIDLGVGENRSDVDFGYAWQFYD